ncbi:MAG TPA: SCE4755 family polysaccharide monooxygenase-like protein [Polyangiaceae bacterium]|nr:SCE4755 family polysaccharide monooxygenase-like protein [Polyangiaceae bacterium]
MNQGWSRTRALGAGAFIPSLGLTFAALLTVAPAGAHFKLEAPDAWAEQDNLGNPQKAGPCGERDSGTTDTAKPTNKVTAYKAGDTITIKLTETVPHPGHYRVALAKTRAELPPDPKVTAGSTACGSAEIDMTPEFPVLVDGALQHTQNLSGQQTISVKLPSDFSCENCTLQVIEFMSNHGLNNPGGCFYHHCANISVSATGDSGTGGAGTGGSGQGSGGQGGSPQAGSTQGGASAAGATNGGAAAGGSMSSGGTLAQTGGASGSGGASATGAATSSGGVSNTGGAAAPGGSSAGGAPAQGGASSAGNPSTGSAGTPASSAGNSGNPPSGGDDDGGCSIGSLPSAGSSGLGLAFAAAALGFARRRRTRRG